MGFSCTRVQLHDFSVTMEFSCTMVQLHCASVIVVLLLGVQLHGGSAAMELSYYIVVMLFLML